MPLTALVYKNLGETPLEAIERFRTERILIDRENSVKNSASNLINNQIVDSVRNSIIWETIPMTYAGRLDPMAEGELLILIGEECKNKEKYLGLDKEYEVEILFGVTTDTHDLLGLVTDVAQDKFMKVTAKIKNDVHFHSSKLHSIDLSKYIGKLSQPYPAYSSKTVNGKQLHKLARANELPEEMPEKEVEIYSLSELPPSSSGRNRSWTTISAQELKTRILKTIDLVKGDFRQQEIKKRWEEVLCNPNIVFDVLTIKVRCSSGTYMRSLAHKMGQDMSCGAIALNIKRTRISMNNTRIM